ncbi:DUF1837 domain-containing protein [Sphingomonas sp. NCPPB 2930]
MNFEILIDDSFAKVDKQSTLSPIHNKYVLSLANDFEEGKWRHQKFESFIWDNIAETSLSARERASLVDKSHSTLIAAAKNLRLTDGEKDIGKGSELAEIVLYGLMKHHYKALPVVPKIFYKQSAQDNAKGADSVHIVVDPSGDFTLWFGEAKFFNNIEDARLGSVIESVGNSLRTEKLKKENSIITNVREIQELIADPEISNKITAALSNQLSIDILKPRIHIPILLLHECVITGGCGEMTDAYKLELAVWHRDRSIAYFKAQLAKLGGISKYGAIKFHLIIFPVPNKKNIVDKFVANVAHFKGI